MRLCRVLAALKPPALLRRRATTCAALWLRLSPLAAAAAHVCQPHAEPQCHRGDTARHQCAQVEKAPVVIKTGVPKADAEAAKKSLEGTGAKVALE